jgi:hypothetical protein
MDSSISPTHGGPKKQGRSLEEILSGRSPYGCLRLAVWLLMRSVLTKAKRTKMPNFIDLHQYETVIGSTKAKTLDCPPCDLLIKQ